jgi:putative transposase
MCERYGIQFVKQEESYTSKASFLDKDLIPVLGEKEELNRKFSGERNYRGLYKT